MVGTDFQGLEVPGNHRVPFGQKISSMSSKVSSSKVSRTRAGSSSRKANSTGTAICLLCVAIFSTICWPNNRAFAQFAGGPYSIESVTINGGGTISVGGPYTIKASTGQSGGVGTIIAEPTSGGVLYQLDDGFWPRLALDCNDNAIPDDVDTMDCSPGDANCTDCNSDGAIDVCVLNAGPPILPIPTSVPKNRYLSFMIGGAGGGAMHVPLPHGRGSEIGGRGSDQAIRITLTSLHHPRPANLSQFPAPNFDATQCNVRWVGFPSDCEESEVQATTFKCATLQCEPEYVDWAAELGSATLHITGMEIVPSSVYVAQAIESGANINDENAYSGPLVLQTARWGDVTSPFQDAHNPNINQPNISDVAALVDKFKDLPGAIIKARAQLRPDSPNPNARIDIRDVAAAVDAFKGFAYPFSITSNCP